MFDPIVGIIGAALYLLGFATCAILCIGKQSDKPISCATCKHSKGGRCDYYNANCAKCLLEGVFTGYQADKPISCETCKHSKRGRANAYDKNCAKCLCEGVFTGYERKGRL